MNYVGAEYLTTGITVAKMVDTQMKAKWLCMVELEKLLKG
jgi:hypothetical protein